MDKKVVEELIQQDLNEQQLIKHLNIILKEENRSEMINEFKELKHKLGNSGASLNAAQKIVAFANKK